MKDLSQKCSRRNFIKDNAKTVAKIAIGSFTYSVLQACASDDEPGSPILRIDLNLPENDSLKSIGGTLAITNKPIKSATSPNGLETSDPLYNILLYGILLYRESSTSVIAYSRRCTHADCIIEPFDNNESVCFCHASKFSLNGDAIDGPANTPLDTFTATLENDIVSVNANSLMVASV